MTTFRIASMSALALATLTTSSLLVGCNDDVETPPWYPSYTDSGYGGAKPAGGAAGAPSAAGATNAGSGGNSAAGSNGESGEGGEAGAL